MRRLVLALLTVAILLGVAPASAQVLPVRISLLREREMLNLVVQASDTASLLDFRFRWLSDQGWIIQGSLEKEEIATLPCTDPGASEMY